jgi:drug/metabolite transporter (DMT)-like permease
MAPVISAFLAGLLLREHLRWPVLLSLCFGVCGVLLMFGPQFAGTSATSATLLGYVAAMSSAAIAAVNLYQVQLLRRTDTNVAIIFYFLLGASFFSLWSIAFGWQGLTIGDGLMLVGAGLFGGLGQIAVVAACRKIPMSLVASLDYCFLMWMTIIDIVVLGNIPTVSTILAVGIILSSSFLLTLLSFFPQKPRQAADRTAPGGRDLQLALVEPVGDVK